MLLQKIAVSLALLLTFLPAKAQDGWQLLSNGQFTKAKQAFQTELSTQSPSESALLGAIFLAETTQDYSNYQQYTNQLLRSEWNPSYWWLFGHMYDGKPEEAMAKPLPTGQAVGLALQYSDSLFKYRKFEASEALANAHVPTWNWAVTGPFPNVSGSGFMEKTQVETAPFQINTLFKTEEGYEFSWVKRAVFAPGSAVTFDALPQPKGLGTFYANTFLTVPSSRYATLMISRSQPMKIWLDDQLLFESDQRTGYRWDGESISFELSAGNHRLLVKTAALPNDELTSKVGLHFNDISDDGDLFFENDNYMGNGNNYQGYSAYSKGDFILRLLDQQGKMMSDIVGNFDGKYTAKRDAWSAPTVKNREYAQLIQLKNSAIPMAARRYLAAKAYAKMEEWEQGEAFFADAQTTDFDRFLLAKFFDANGKGEKAEALISEMDTIEAPTLSWHLLALQKTDPEQNETAFVSALEKTLAVSPTNSFVLAKYLGFLKRKGKKDTIQAYVRSFLKEHPDKKWKARLEPFLEDDSYKPESYKERTDKEREKEFKEAFKQIKKRFEMSDYGTVIEYYKQKDKVDDALKYFNEVLATVPYYFDYANQKGRYLFEKERYDDALSTLKQQIENQPYNAELFETIGDIFLEKKQSKEALEYYARAKKLELVTNGYSLLALNEKIEKLQNRTKLSDLFEPINLDKAAADRSWQETYKNDESVISLYAQQLCYYPEEKKMEVTRKMVVHILTEAGAKQWTEADLRQIGAITSAKVIKKDGSVTSPDQNYGYVVFKNLQVGDVIQIEGGGELGFPEEIPNDFLHIEIISFMAPVAKASLSLLIPQNMDIHAATNGLNPQFDSQKDTASYKILTWNWRNLKKLVQEDALPDNYDAYSWIMLGNKSNWSEVVRWYQRKTYQRYDGNYETRAQAQALITPGMSQEKIVETLHNFITKEISYSFVPFLNTNYVPKKPGSTLAAKVGDCKDVATLMVSMLQDNNIPAWYTLVSTHNFSEQEPLPTLFVFNHVIVAYQLKDGITRFADLTTDYYPNGTLPEFDCNGWGLIIRDGENKVFRLPNHAMNPEKTGIKINAKAAVDEMNTLHLDLEYEATGDAGGKWREQLIPATGEDRRKHLSEYFGGGVLTHLDIEKFDFENLEDINGPLRAVGQFSAFNHMDKVAHLYIMSLPLPMSTATAKALFANKRYNDTDLEKLFDLFPVQETIELTFPKGFQLLEKPQNVVLNESFGEYKLVFEETKDGLKIYRSVQYQNRFVKNADFAAFKKFYLAMLDADDVKLAFTKR